MNEHPKEMSPPIRPDLYQEVSQFGARDMEICMQCGNCSASCPLSTGNDAFPRKIYRFLQLGLRDELLRSAEPWLCYYCGECNTDCPRGAEPAETMMAVRRWLTTQYDWTGLAKRLYLSEAWEIGALGGVSLLIILLFVFFHGPVITDHVSVNSFAPVVWIEIGDLLMAAILSSFLLSNAFRMARFIMAGTRVPLRLYLTEAKSFVLHFATQKRWRDCGDDKGRWLRHFILVTGYMTMMTLIIVFIRWFQVDDESWHFSSIFGYYATAVLLYLTVDMAVSRRKKKETIHRFSEPTDWLFLLLLFLTTLTGILMHLVRLAGWPMGTYVMYVIHLAIAVPMLVIEVPFGKWSHMFYRPLAIFLTTVREKALTASARGLEAVRAEAGAAFLACLQCGTCSSLCPINTVSDFNPRRIMRKIALDAATVQGVDEAAWNCVTCNSCGINCPRGIDIIGLFRAVRKLNGREKKIPQHIKAPLHSLMQNHNPWNGLQEKRMEWAGGLALPFCAPEHEYCLFTCCTTAYDKSLSRLGNRVARILPLLMVHAGVTFGTLGEKEGCCGDPARSFGSSDLFANLREDNTALFTHLGVQKILAHSPHCLDTFKKEYPGLNGSVAVEHYTELLDRLMTGGRLLPTIECDRVVTFHDPCYLGRHNGIYEAPRRILKGIPGLKLVEMFNNREKSLCCGGGGGHAWDMGPQPARQLGTLRVQEALSCGAEIIATACPFCMRMLGEATERLGAGDRIAVMDVAELLFTAMEGVNEMKPASEGRLIKDREACHV